ncbi:MAG: hypothetical protein OXG19_04970 [Chloroflexi bacterium]|nr:hypothetical protein [Chloroflexota bacterium]
MADSIDVGFLCERHAMVQDMLILHQLTGHEQGIFLPVLSLSVPMEEGYVGKDLWLDLTPHAGGKAYPGASIMVIEGNQRDPEKWAFTEHHPVRVERNAIVGIRSEHGTDELLAVEWYMHALVDKGYGLTDDHRTLRKQIIRVVTAEGWENWMRFGTA